MKIIIIIALFLIFGSASYAQNKNNPPGNDSKTGSGEGSNNKVIMKTLLEEIKKINNRIDRLEEAKPEEKKNKPDISEMIKEIKNKADDMVNEAEKYKGLANAEKRFGKAKLELELARKDARRVPLNRKSNEIVRRLESYRHLAVNMKKPPMYSYEGGLYYTEFELLTPEQRQPDSEKARQKALQAAKEEGLSPNDYFRNMQAATGDGYASGGRSFVGGPFSFERWKRFNQSLFLPTVRLRPGAWEALTNDGGDTWIFMTAMSNAIMPAMTVPGNWNVPGMNAYRKVFGETLADAGNTALLNGARGAALTQAKDNLAERRCLPETLELLSNYSTVGADLEATERNFFEEKKSPKCCHFTRYTIKEGDTWWDLAERHLGCGNKYKVLADFNGVNPDTPLSVGQVVKIPVRR